MNYREREKECECVCVFACVRGLDAGRVWSDVIFWLVKSGALGAGLAAGGGLVSMQRRLLLH